MLHLYLLRHGIAVEYLGPSGRDADRPLTPEGIEKMREEARGMLRLGIEFDFIFTSPYLRTRQTSDAVAEVMGLPADRIIVVDALGAGRPFASTPYLKSPAFIDIGAFDFSRALIVGHMPDLSEMTSLLVTGALNSRFEFSKGALAHIEVADLPPRAPGVFRWLLTPRQLCNLAS